MYNPNVTHEELLEHFIPELRDIQPLTDSRIDQLLGQLAYLEKQGDLAPGKTLTCDNGNAVRVERRITYFKDEHGHRFVLLHKPWPDYQTIEGGCALPEIDLNLDLLPFDLPNCVFVRTLTDSEIETHARGWKTGTVNEAGSVPDANVALLYLAPCFICALEIDGGLETPADQWKITRGELWFDPFVDIDSDSLWNQSPATFSRIIKTPNTLDKFNERYAFVTVGSKGRVMEEYTNAAGDPDFRLLDKETFVTQYSALQNHKGKSLAKLWLESKKRRTFDEIIFAPGNKSPRFYNMWRGFSVSPVPGYNHLRFLDHIKYNVCQGDESLTNWVIGWFAHIMQHPGEKIGTSLALRGTQGCGKTLVGQHIGKLIKPYYRIVADARHVTGNFNAHLAGTLLLQAEEAFWAGDKAAEGMLKHLVTSDTLMLERKGIDSVPVQNYSRLLITTNHRWVVPAALEERRFAVVDVSDQHAQDADYFGAIVRDLENGGYAHLLHFLLNFDLNAVNLRQVPQTDALLDQKIESLEPHDKWWLACLQDGQIDEYNDWPAEIHADALHSRYRHYCVLHGIRRPLDSRQFGQILKKHVPQLKRVRKRDSDGRHYAYVLPDLKTCRSLFAESIRAPHLF